MSIWCSHPVVGFDPDFGEHDGQVRSYASGWSNHYPTSDGDVEQEAFIDTGHIPAWCVPGHTDEASELSEDVGPWLRLSVYSTEHDGHKVLGAESAHVVMDEDATRALVERLTSWLAVPKVHPVTHDETR